MPKGVYVRTKAVLKKLSDAARERVHDKVRTKAEAAIYLKSRIRVLKRGCWVWTGLLDEYGYGICCLLGHYFAHRLSYYVFKRKIPKGKQVCHDCPGGDRKDCINPDHLHAWSAKRHGADRVAKSQMCKGKEHGKRSHPSGMRVQSGKQHWTRRRKDALKILRAGWEKRRLCG
jgi:hypothetical protein